jgi:hypothetical protein
VISGPLAL